MKIEETVKNLTVRANVKLRPDVLCLLKRAFDRENVPLAKHALEVIIRNSRIASREGMAVCQDTGLPLLFIEAGRDVALTGDIIRRINKGVTLAYDRAGFRASGVEPGKDSCFYNPEIYHVKFSRRKGIKITVFPKGFGSENKSRLKMFLPTVQEEEIDRFILESVIEAGPAACPPFIVGVGIGSTSDGCLLLAKEALINDLRRPNPDKRINAWERRLNDKINRLKIGAMGFGGRTTALAVRIKTYPTHIAGMPVGVNISCHALRGASGIIKAEDLKN